MTASPPRELDPDSEREPSGPDEALARLRGLETLEAAYEAWNDLRRHQEVARQRFREERERLSHQGDFLLGAVRAAGLMVPEGAAPALTPASDAQGFMRDAEARLGKTRDALAEREADSESRYVAAMEEIRATLLDRVRRYATASQPGLTLVLRRVGAERAILHVSRVATDASVLLCYQLTGRLPTRYGFLADDSTEDVSLAPAPLYPDEDVLADAVRPGARALVDRMRAPGVALPIKGFLPVFVPRSDGGEDFFRLLQRGPVLEVELADGDAFRHVLARDEAERFAGHLLRLKLEGRIGLDIEAG
ncbi:hypothetical protein DRW03_00535 [Corallococcus sp. H22C18031201]|nr:hypothetical protein DRW03_00535 [Corallococcus sp. H22C18031201]